MRRLEAGRKPERKTKDSMPPARDSMDNFKLESDRIIGERLVIVKRKINNGDFASAKKNIGKIFDIEPKNKYAISMLAKLYLKMGDIEKAEEVFHENKSRNNNYLYNAMIVGYGKTKKHEKAKEVFAEAVDKGIADVYSYNSMIDMYCDELELEKVMKLFNEAVELELANSYTYNRTIYTCARVIEEMPRDDRSKIDEIIKEAEQVFDKADEAGVVNGHTYTSLLAVYSNIRNKGACMELLFEAIRKRLDTPSAYKKVLYACGRIGDTRGVKYVYRLAKKNRMATKELKDRADRFVSYQEEK